MFLSVELLCSGSRMLKKTQSKKTPSAPCANIVEAIDSADLHLIKNAIVSESKRGKKTMSLEKLISEAASLCDLHFHPLSWGSTCYPKKCSSISYTRKLPPAKHVLGDCIALCAPNMSAQPRTYFYEQVVLESLLNRAITYCYDLYLLESFLETLDVELIVRAHQVLR